MNSVRYEPVIGLEIHTELKTKTKMFCYSLNDPNEKHPNINICPICMGHPGTLPVINEEAIKKVIMVGLALNGNVAQFSQFDRKNYFYPDLPKGYQISQYQHPLVIGGYLDIEIRNNTEIKKSKSLPTTPPWASLASGGGLASGGKTQNKSEVQNPNDQNATRRIRIRRIHLEEDTGRLIHDPKNKASLVDFNRAGVPLMELVTEPDLNSAEEVKKFGEEFRQILRYSGASDADMEKGQLRIEVNISLQPVTNNQLPVTSKEGTKVEIKNINSFKFAANAIEYEIKRQGAALDRGEQIIQETRGWDENKRSTFSQRSKEEAQDYRYFPEPDLPPLKITKEQTEELRSKLPEMPKRKKERFKKEYGLPDETAEILTRDKSLADYFEEVASEIEELDRETKEKPRQNLIPLTANFLTGELLHLLNQKATAINEVNLKPENLAELILYFAEDKISNLTLKQVLGEMLKSGEDPSDIIDKLGLWQLSDAKDLEDIVNHIVRENPHAVEDYKKGKTAALKFLVGQVMKETRGKANPKIVESILGKKLAQ